MPEAEPPATSIAYHPASHWRRFRILSENSSAGNDGNAQQELTKDERQTRQKLSGGAGRRPGKLKENRRKHIRQAECDRLVSAAVFFDRRRTLSEFTRLFLRLRASTC